MKKSLRYIFLCIALFLFVLIGIFTTQISTARVATTATSLNLKAYVMHSFTRQKPDGGEPLAGLVQSSDGYLYGTTNFGGANDGGMIFRIAPDGSKFESLYSFKPNFQPRSRLIEGEDGRSFYGTTFAGANQGTIFRFTLDANRKLKEFNTLYSFNTTGEAATELTKGDDGNFYGTTTNNSVSSGTFFSIDTKGTFKSLYKFNADTGLFLSGLTTSNDGKLFYGIARAGGVLPGGGGVLYGIPPKSSTQYPSVKPYNLYSFSCITDNSHGCTPIGGVVQDANGNLYGTTSNGGTFNLGTIFKYTQATGKLTTIHNFSSSEGSPKDARLFLASDGKLYGTTIAADSGVVYRISTNGTDDFQVIHSRTLPNDPGPGNELIQGQDGSLYGTSAGGGGPSNEGTVYKIDGKDVGLNRPYPILYSVKRATSLLTSKDLSSTDRLPNFLYIKSSSGNIYDLKDLCIAEVVKYVDTQGNFSNPIYMPSPFVASDGDDKGKTAQLVENFPGFKSVWGAFGTQCDLPTGAKAAGGISALGYNQAAGYFFDTHGTYNVAKPLPTDLTGNLYTGQTFIWFKKGSFWDNHPLIWEYDSSWIPGRYPLVGSNGNQFVLRRRITIEPGSTCLKTVYENVEFIGYSGLKKRLEPQPPIACIGQ